MNDIDSNYVEFNQNVQINFQRFYDDLGSKKWERVISEENVDDEECKESSAGFGDAQHDAHVYNKIVYTPRTGHAVVEQGGVFYLFAGADAESRTNDMYKFNPVTKQWHQIFPATGDSQINNHNPVNSLRGFQRGYGLQAHRDVAMNDQSENLVPQPIHCQPKARSGARAISYRDSLYFFGGYTRKGGTYFNDLYQYKV